MGPLSGIKVIDFSRLAPGPYCSMILADLGAEVVRIERPGEGAGPFGDTVGRGKKSVVMNLKDPDAVAVAAQLCAESDVVLEGFRPGVMERLGLGPDELTAANPRLVYARMTGWGQDGPLANVAGHDTNYIAVAGVLAAFGERDRKPVPPVNLVGDFAGGSLFCVVGILAALIERERSGAGQVIDAAMVDGAAHLFSFFAKAVNDGWWGPRGTNILDGGWHFYDTYETSDGKWMSVGSLEPQFYAKFLELLGLPNDWSATQLDPGTNEEKRTRVAEVFRSRTRDEWVKVFESSDACVFGVLEPSEAPNHPANQARGVFIDVDGVKQPAPAPRFSRTSGAAGRPPEPGAHTDEVLAAIGLTTERIEELRDKGAIA